VEAGRIRTLIQVTPAFPERVAELFDRRTPRERYEASLQDAGLTNTALARDWTSAAERSLREAPLVSSPYAEEGYLPPAEPAALAFRLNVRRGQEISFNVQLLGDTATLLFLEAWQVDGDTTQPFRQVAVADSGERSLSFEPRQDGALVMRAQPELLRGGRFRVTLRVGPTLAFPIRDGRERDIHSGFGAPRDAGARDHHGIDIFVPRGTAAVAAAEAVVSRVQTTPRGGNVVWLRDDRGNSIYYAHLDRQSVAQGQRVHPGDTVGFVGNTGNASTTPPHLHFGVYRRGEGPMNPFWFVHRPRGELARLSADTGMLGEWARTPRDRTVLRRAPDARAESLLALPRHTALRVVSAVGGWYRVRLPDGITGYVTASLTEPTRRAVRTTEVRQAVPLLARPLDAPAPGDIMAQVGPGESVDVLGRFGSYWLVRASGGTAGWVAH